MSNVRFRHHHGGATSDIFLETKNLTHSFMNLAYFIQAYLFTCLLSEYSFLFFGLLFVQLTVNLVRMPRGIGV